MRGSMSEADPQTIVLNPDHNLVHDSFRAYDNLPAWWRVLRCIIQQIRDYLGQPSRVAVDADTLPRLRHRKLMGPLLG